MNDVRRDSRFLATGVVPSMLLGSQVERDASRIFQLVDEYKFTENDALVGEIATVTANMDGDLKTAFDLFVANPALQGLKPLVEEVLPAYKAYSERLTEAENLITRKEEMFRVASTAGNEFQAIVTNDLLIEDYEHLEDANRAGDREKVNAYALRIREGEGIITQLVNMRLAVYVSMYRQDMKGLEGVLSLLDKLVNSIEGMNRLAITQEDRKNFSNAAETAKKYRDILAEYIRYHIETQENHTARLPYKKTVAEKSGQASLYSQNRVKSIAEETEASLGAAILLLVVSTCLSVVLGLIIALWIARMITRPLSVIVSLANRASDGDLTIRRQEFGYEGKDELGTLVSSLSDMVSEQEKAIIRVMEVAEEVSAGAENLSAIAEETNASMDEVKTSVGKVSALAESNGAELEECNAGIEEVSSGADTTAQSATESANFIAETTEAANGAVVAVQQLIGNINIVSDKSVDMEKRINELGVAVEQISGFVTVITGIADQTNLLALNAAIEAARAGDVGRGFAVVAEEVRKLAEESARSAQSVNTLISALQTSAAHAITATTESGKILKETLHQAGDAQTRLSSAMVEIQKANESIQSIAAVAEEQAASSKEIATAIDNSTRSTIAIAETIDNIRNSTDETAEAAQRVATFSESMSKSATLLRELLSHFKTRKDEGARSAIKALRG